MYRGAKYKLLGAPVLWTLLQPLWAIAKGVRGQVKPLGAKTKLLGTQSELLGTKVKCVEPLVGFRDAYLDILCSSTADEVYGRT